MSAGRHLGTLATMVVTSLFLASAARADAPDAPARSQALFENALKLMETGNFARACPMLAESFALDPAGGTALDLGFCYEHADRLASALHAYRQALDIADADGRADRSIAAKNKILELEKSTGRARLVVPRDAWQSENWHALVDGLPLRPEDLSSPTPLDQGAHVVMITADGKQTYVRNVAVNDGMTTDVVVDSLVDARALSAANPPSRDLRPSNRPFVVRDDVPRRNWGIAVGSVGFVGLGLGTVAAIAAASLHAQSNDACPATGCTGNGIDSEKQADRMAWIANISFVTGAVLVGAGAYLFFSARHAQRVPAMTALARGRFAFDFP